MPLPVRAVCLPSRGWRGLPQPVTHGCIASPEFQQSDAVSGAILLLFVHQQILPAKVTTGTPGRFMR